MAQFIVRQLEEGLKERLKRRAERNGRSMEAEIREILRSAATDGDSSPVKMGTRIARRFSGIGISRDLPELRGQSPKPADFDK